MLNRTYVNPRTPKYFLRFTRHFLLKIPLYLLLHLLGSHRISQQFLYCCPNLRSEPRWCPDTHIFCFRHIHLYLYSSINFRVMYTISSQSSAIITTWPSAKHKVCFRSILYETIRLTCDNVFSQILLISSLLVSNFAIIYC